MSELKNERTVRASFQQTKFQHKTFYRLWGKYGWMRLRGFVGMFYWSLQHEVEEVSGPSLGIYHGWARTRSIIWPPCVTDSTQLFISWLRETHESTPRVCTNHGDSVLCCSQKQALPYRSTPCPCVSEVRHNTSILNILIQYYEMKVTNEECEMGLKAPKLK